MYLTTVLTATLLALFVWSRISTERVEAKPYLIAVAGVFASCAAAVALIFTVFGLWG